MRFVVLVNEANDITDFFNVHRLAIYEKKATWELVEYSKIHKVNVQIRTNIEKLTNEICSIMKEKGSDMLIGTTIVGLPYYKFCASGIIVCEVDHISQDAFQIIHEDFYERKVQETVEEVPPYPVCTHENGLYVFDFDKAMGVHKELSSKKMLIPFLQKGSFKTLSILCSHIMPWLEYYVEMYNLKMHSKREGERYLVTIVQGAIEVGCNRFIPKYSALDTRSRDITSVEYYPSGQLKSIYLETVHKVKVASGVINAEYVTFYKDGSIHRLFPVYGKLSGYWSEEEEKGLLQENTISVSGESFTGKFSCICFYPSGEVKSLTIWPGESIVTTFCKRMVEVRNGISFYENGAIKSFEPKKPLLIQHVTGSYVAYDPLANGISGDFTSLSLNSDGKVKSLKTTLTGILYSQLDNRQGETQQETLKKLQPQPVMSPYDMEEQILMPMKIEFSRNKICITDSFNQSHMLSIKQVRKTYQVKDNIQYMTCGDCNSCKQCFKGQ